MANPVLLRPDFCQLCQLTPGGGPAADSLTVCSAVRASAAPTGAGAFVFVDRVDASTIARTARRIGSRSAGQAATSLVTSALAWGLGTPGGTREGVGSEEVPGFAAFPPIPFRSSEPRVGNSYLRSPLAWCLETSRPLVDLFDDGQPQTPRCSVARGSGRHLVKCLTLQEPPCLRLHRPPTA